MSKEKFSFFKKPEKPFTPGDFEMEIGPGLQEVPDVGKKEDITEKGVIGSDIPEEIITNQEGITKKKREEEERKKKPQYDS